MVWECLKLGIVLEPKNWLTKDRHKNTVSKEPCYHLNKKMEVNGHTVHGSEIRRKPTWDVKKNIPISL